MGFFGNFKEELAEAQRGGTDYSRFHPDPHLPTLPPPLGVPDDSARSAAQKAAARRIAYERSQGVYY